MFLNINSEEGDYRDLYSHRSDHSIIPCSCSIQQNESISWYIRRLYARCRMAHCIWCCSGYFTRHMVVLFHLQLESRIILIRKHREKKMEVQEKEEDSGELKIGERREVRGVVFVWQVMRVGDAPRWLTESEDWGRQTMRDSMT